jgi:hypothetical protein
MHEDDDLAIRILNAVPARSYAMNALLSLLAIEASDEVATAAVSCTARPVLRVNPAFVEAHCQTDEHLFLLVMHELHHVLLGHTRLFPRVTPAHNIAFDAVINALLCAQFPERAYTSFFLDYYGDQAGPLRLLAPPARGCTTGDGALDALHRLLYGSGDVTSDEIFQRLTAALGKHGTGPGAAELLGSHGAEGEWGTGGPLPREVVEAIRHIVEKWPPPADPTRGRSLSELLQRARLDPARPGERVLAAVRRALLGAATRSAVASRQRTVGPVQACVVWPQLRDRRATTLRAAGGTPLLYESTVVAPHGRDGGRADVYLDVSGSMDAYVRWLYGALSALRDHISPTLRLFSTCVCPVGLAALGTGEVQTTGGTDLACVVQDIRQRRPHKVLIVTDGYVGAPTKDDQRWLARHTEVRVLLTPSGWRRDLEGIATRIDELPRLECGVRS